MRVSILALALATFATAAVAQSTSEQSARRSAYEANLLDENARVKECLELWERSTHMTRKEWEATCRRVAKERVKYLRDHGYGAENAKPATRGKAP